MKTFLLALSCALVACSKSDLPVQAPTQSKGAAQPATDHDHEHEMANDLGAVTTGSATFRVVQRAAIRPGGEADFDLVFPAGTALPEAVRGWIGIESAVGSRKVRFLKENATTMHAHPEVPDPIPPEARLWIEVEGQGRASLPLPR